MKMKKNLLKMALLAVATFAASVASAQTYSGKITSSDWSGDKGLESDVDYSLTYIESTKKLNFEFTVPCDKKIINAYFFAEYGFGETKIEVPQSVGGTYALSGTTGGAFLLGKGDETWFFLKLTIEGVGDIVTNHIAYKAGEGNTAEDTEAPAWVSDPTAVASSTSATISVNANDNVSKTLTYEVSETADFATLETVNGKANETTEIALKGLSPKTDYTYYVRVKDMAGNVGDVKTVTFTTTAQAAVVATYYGVFYANDWEEKATVNGKEVTPQINWKAETLEGYNDVIVTAELLEALPDGAALKFYAFIEGGVGQVYDNDMTATGKVNEYTIKLSEVLPEGKTLSENQIFSQFFFRLYPTGEGAFSRTKILTTYKVGASNDPIATDTKAPEWGVDPVVEKVTDKAAEIVVNVTDDSGSAVITLTGDNGFAELKKEVKADGSNQTIALNGLMANTAYNLTLAIADAAGNAGKSKTVNFTTLETPDREVLYHSFDFTSENWKKHGQGGSNTFAPNGRLLLTVNADNTVTVKVTVDEGAETVDNAQVILHGIETFWINAQEDGSFVGTSTNSISNRDASQVFHLNFVLKNGVGNSELYYDGMSFTPSEGSTSAVAEVEAEAAKVVAANGVIRVEGDKTFAVYTVAGQLAFRGMGEVRLDKGVYVVVVDGKAQKVML